MSSFEVAWNSIAKFDEDYLERPELESDPHWVMGGISDDLAFDDPNNLDCIEKVRRFLMAISYKGYMRTKDDPASGELWDHYANQPAEHLEAFLRQYNFPSHQIADVGRLQGGKKTGTCRRGRPFFAPSSF